MLPTKPRELCDPQDATYCMNGGTCYKMPSIDTFFYLFYPNKFRTKKEVPLLSNQTQSDLMEAYIPN
uniref:Uncharacterized protein n=1 Tax=Cyprinodon variegatus TaxID=28743 RepID=A0A3Q2D5B9_CYPVA